MDADAWWRRDRAGSVGARISQHMKFEMNTPFWGNIDSRRLARAYVALAFAQDVAKGYVKEHASAHPILSALDMSAKLLEEICEDIRRELDHSITIDMSGVNFLGSRSAEVIRRLRTMPGLSIEGAHLFVQQILEADGNHHE